MAKIKFRRISIIIDIILGIIFHFTYEWSNKNSFVALFSAVNESTWEHLKLVFFPILITSIIGYIFMKNEISNYWCSRLFGIILAMLFIVIAFYTYTGVIGTNFAIINILIFIIAVIIGEWISYLKMSKNKKCNNKNAIIIILVLLILFIIFTFMPPKINLFKDPITGDFGINKKIRIISNFFSNH